MSALADHTLPRPKDWQSFERATRALFRHVLRDPNTQMHGRNGQPQHGVDVYGHRDEDRSRLVGVQCKRSEDEISEEELRGELEKAKKFEPQIAEFILVTTAARDGKIQEVARKLTQELSTSDRPILVNVWGWQDVEEHAANSAEAWRAFDPTWTPFAAEAHEKQLAKLEDLQTQVAALNTRDTEAPNIEKALPHVLACAHADLEAFKRMPTWPKTAVKLDLRVTLNDRTAVIDARGLSTLLAENIDAELVGPPGMGKTTTMLQLAEALTIDSGVPAFFIPLDEWATDPDAFLAYLARQIRPGLPALTVAQLAEVANGGRLSLVLDAWNQVTPDARKRANRELKAFRRSFPLAPVIVSSRSQEAGKSVAGLAVGIDDLSESQQLEIAQTLRGADGEVILDHAWRTAGVRDLVSIPLYLTALLKASLGGKLPSTKGEALALFVGQHEADPEKTGYIRATLSERHRDVLTALAVEAIGRGTTALPEADARKIVARVSREFADELTTPLEPITVLDGLVDYHLLVRTPANSGRVSFQHPQFQEWHASFEVEKLVGDFGRTNEFATEELRAILNDRRWEEPVLFACERLSIVGEGGAKAVGKAILETLGIDPLLAAEMIHRSSDETWQIVKSEAVNFAKRWHTPGTVDRAVAFMITTGRNDFAEMIWPLLADPDDQVHLAVLRAGRRFRPSVLGDDLVARLQPLPEELRAHIVSEIAGRSGMDGMELAASLAIRDPSAKVQIETIQDLLFRRADRLAAQILKEAPDEVWQDTARKGYDAEIKDSKVAARLHQEREAYWAAETDGVAKLRQLIFPPELAQEQDGPQVAALIEAGTFPIGDRQADALIYEASKGFPAEVASALLLRLEAGREIPFRTEEILKGRGVISRSEQLAERVLRSSKDDRVAGAAASVLSAASVCKLIDRLVEVDAKAQIAELADREAIREEYWHLLTLLQKTSSPALAEAVLNRPAPTSASEIGRLAEIMARHFRREEGDVFHLADDVAQQLAEMTGQWAEALLQSPDATRNEFADIARVIERLPNPSSLSILKTLLAEDLVRWRKARSEFADLKKQGRQHDSDARISNVLQYQSAFAAIGGDEVAEVMVAYLSDPDFGFHAAQVLKTIWEREHRPPKDQKFGFRTDYADVADRRAARLDQNRAPQKCPYADAILAAAMNLANSATDQTEQRRAIALAQVGLSLPNDASAENIATLLALPTPARTKLSLLSVLVEDGHVISADIPLNGIRALIEDAKKEPWRLDDSHNEHERWLELLALSDKPVAILEALALIPERFKHPWKLRGLLRALRYAPSQDAENVLQRLAEEDPRWLAEHDWLDALVGRQTPSSLRIALEIIYTYRPADTRDRVSRWEITGKITASLRKNPEVKAELFERFKSIPSTPGKAIAAGIIAELGDPDGVLLLIQEYAALGAALDGLLRSALRNVAVGQRPSEEWIGHEEMFSVPLPGLRKALFDMTQGDGAAAKIAIACLAELDELRDDYGQPESEPRHPDIASNRPWPIIRQD